MLAKLRNYCNKMLMLFYEVHISKIKSSTNTTSRTDFSTKVILVSAASDLRMTEATLQARGQRLTAELGTGRNYVCPQLLPQVQRKFISISST